MTVTQSSPDHVTRAGPQGDGLQRQRFAIEPLEDRIAPEGALLNLNLNVIVQDVNITIQDVNVVVAGNVIQVGILSGPMTGNVTSYTNVV